MADAHRGTRRARGSAGSIKGGVFVRQVEVGGGTFPQVVYIATFLPVRRWRHVIPFMRMSSKVAGQLQGTPGLLRFGLRADPLRKRFWTVSVWKDRASADAFVRTDPHLTATSRFADWAGDGAAFVSWSSGDGTIDWDDALRRLKNPTFYFQGK